MDDRLIGVPTAKQREVMLAKHKHVGFGGARGGGKSWMVRAKAKLLAIKWPGIKQLIIRRSYQELIDNHMSFLREELAGVARYNESRHELRFKNGSLIRGMYCARDADLDRLQGQEYDVIFFDEATQLSEWQLKSITATLRGVNSYPKRCYYTCNPGGQGHDYIKRIFIDRRYEDGEDPDDYYFVQALVTDNMALMEAQPDYVRQLEALPPKLRRAWLYGDWDVYEGQFFEDFCAAPDRGACEAAGITVEEARRQRRFTHVIEPFTPPPSWPVYRSFDWGYARPFSCGWWTVDNDGTVYRILELYGCTGEPNVGVRWEPERLFSEIRRIETEHSYLAGKMITGVADPSIWDAERGVSIAEVASQHMVVFSPGDNKRVPGWMQFHYRLTFDADGRPGLYIFDTCKAFIRTIPALQYSETVPEDLDTDQEDHVADEARYFLMSRPIKARVTEAPLRRGSDPLNLLR